MIDLLDLTLGPVRVRACDSNRIELTDGPVTASAGGIHKGLPAVVLVPEGADLDVVLHTLRITGEPIAVTLKVYATTQEPEGEEAPWHLLAEQSPDHVSRCTLYRIPLHGAPQVHLQWEVDFTKESVATVTFQIDCLIRRDERAT